MVPHLEEAPISLFPFRLEINVDLTPIKLPGALGEGFHLGDCRFQGFGRWGFSVVEDGCKLAVVPEGLFWGAAESFEN